MKIAVVLCAVALFVGMGWIIPTIAVRDAYPLTPEDRQCAAEHEGQLFDTLIDKLLIVAFSVSDKDGSLMRIKAYTFFAIPYAVAEVTCGGGDRILWRNGGDGVTR